MSKLDVYIHDSGVVEMRTQVRLRPGATRFEEVITKPVIDILNEDSVVPMEATYEVKTWQARDQFHGVAVWVEV